MPKPKVNQEKCIGCGTCESTCPKVFKLNKDGKSQVIGDDCKDCDLKDVAESCPAEAISIK